MRCPGRPALDDPASAFSRRCASRASAEGSPSARRPCGFSLCEHDAVKLDMRNCRLRVLHFSRCAASSRRAQWCFAMSATLRSPVRTAVGESDSIVRYERPVTSSATASLIRHSPAVMHRRVPLARCSATDGEPSRPGRTSESFPLSSGGAPGVPSHPSQACSRSGWATISGRPGPHAFPPARTPRLIFVGSIPPPA